MADTQPAVQEAAQATALAATRGVDVGMALSGQDLSDATKVAAAEAMRVEQAPDSGEGVSAAAAPGIPGAVEIAAAQAATQATTKVLQDALDGRAKPSAGAAAAEEGLAEGPKNAGEEGKTPDVMKNAAREASRAAARERKRKSRMNPVVREKEKVRDRIYKMKARQALKGEKLEAYRKKDRDRKRFKRMEKAKREAEASAEARGGVSAVHPGKQQPTASTVAASIDALSPVPKGQDASGAASAVLAAEGLARARDATAKPDQKAKDDAMDLETSKDATKPARLNGSAAASGAPGSSSLPPAEI